jgi:hypothetical protein
MAALTETPLQQKNNGGAHGPNPGLAIAATTQKSK